MLRRQPIVAPPLAPRESGRDEELCDLRFRALLGAAAWARLPAALHSRFGKRLRPGGAITYVGRIVHSRRTWQGWLLAELARLIGAPLPLSDDVGVPAVVSVTEDAAGGGQFWTRVYGRFGIALNVSADEQALHFHSDHYFVQLGQRRFRLPRWLSPGQLSISHIDFGAEWFAFVLVLDHPLAGEIFSQAGMFRERETPC